MEHDEDDSLLRPALAGACAGLAGGAVWAIIVGLTNYEIGWIAWGIGWAVGWAMCRVTDRRATELAALAAVLALLSLLLGKVLIQQFVTAPQVQNALLEEEDSGARASAWRLDEDKAWPPSIQARLDGMSESDTLSDAMWEEMKAVADSHSSILSPEGRERLVAEYRAAMLADFGPWRQLTSSFSVWDILWFGLAISTAWKLLKGTSSKDEEPATSIGP